MNSAEWRESTIRGISWSLTGSVLKQALNFVIGIVMARLLSPKEFGLIGMLLIFSGLATILIEQGLGAALIQRKEIEPRHLDSVFFLNLLCGFTVTAALAASGHWIASFYHEPVLRPLTVLISLNYLIGSLSVVPNAMLNRRLDFKRLALIDTAALLAAAAVGIVLALRGFGVWSLAWQSLALAALTTVLRWAMSPWRPSFRIDRRSIGDIAWFSGYFFGFNLMNYLERNCDNFLIGRFVGASELGVYARAYQLMLFPVTQISWVIARVMFPALSSIKDDLEKVKRVYLRSIQAIAYVTFPLMVGLLVTSRPFVSVVLGERWNGVIPILQIFCVSGLVQSISTTVGWIYVSQGRTDLQFKWGLLFGAVTVGSIVIGLPWGIRGVAISYALGDILVLYWFWSIPVRLIHLKFSEMLRSISGPFLCAAAMGVALFVLDLALPAQCRPALNLLIRVPIGIGLYWAFTRGFRIQAYNEIREVLLGYFRGRTA